MSAPGRTACFFATMAALVLWSCGGSTATTGSINERAALSGRLPWNPLSGNVITSVIDKQASTMSTLYGNAIAVRYARGHTEQD